MEKDKKQTIKEINSLDGVASHLTKRTLLFLDIDDTLIRSIDHDTNCPNRWFTNQMILASQNKTFRFRGREFWSYCDKNYLEIVKDFNKKVKKTKWKLTETGLLRYFGQWKDRCTLGVWGFTARGKEIGKETTKTLESLGIYFNKSFSGGETIENICCGRTGILHKKIIFCGGFCKKKTLEAFEALEPIDTIKPWQYYWKYLHLKIVFVDDSMTNIKLISEFCKERNIEYVGLHYVPM